MYAFSHIRSFSLTSGSPKTRPKTRVILPKRPKPKKPKKGRPVQSLVKLLRPLVTIDYTHNNFGTQL